MIERRSRLLTFEQAVLLLAAERGSLTGRSVVREYGEPCRSAYRALIRDGHLRKNGKRRKRERIHELSASGLALAASLQATLP